MKLYALTGGIASGKSTVAKVFKEHGAKIIDADQLAREAVAKGSPALTQIREAFGEGVFGIDGELDRAALGTVVFGDSEKLELLNSFVHPRVQELFKEHIQGFVEADPHAIIIYDVPLFVEKVKGGSFDGVIVVSAPEETRIERLISLRGMSAEEARKRVANQASEEERLAVASFVIDASTTILETERQARNVWKEISTREG